LKKGVRINDSDKKQDHRLTRIKLPVHHRLFWEAKKRNISLSDMVEVLLDEFEKENNG
jgi:hypothetical protein